MKRVPPNVTMQPGLDAKMRHASGENLRNSLPGPSGVRNASRHASGDSVYNMIDNSASANNMRRYSGDSILFRRAMTSLDLMSIHNGA